MLYICPTPIGNLGDITLRVLETLRDADLIAAEDTRRARQLLTHFGISKPLVSFYEHNEIARLPELVERLRRGEKIALVSDAGMPGICDPGYRLIQTVLDEGLPLEVLPGPSAVETALVSAGFATDSFVFLGYLPRHRGDRQTVLKRIATEPRTCVAFESPHRLPASLEAVADILPGRRIAICRELTKKFAEIKRGTPAELIASLPEKIKGEIVLVFEENPDATGENDAPDEALLVNTLEQMLAAGLSPRRAADIVSQLTGVSKNRIYRMALKLK